jgi:peptidoglycan/LPS O-acetylase OafA/YrhL
VKIQFYFLFPLFIVGAIYFLGTIIIENFLNILIGVALAGLAFLSLALADRRQENDYS